MSTVAVEYSVAHEQLPVRRTKIRSATQTLLAACAFIGAAWAGPAAAGTSVPDEAIANLRSYVQTVATSPAPQADASISALQEFVRGIGSDGTAAAAVKVADADNLFDALRQWGSGGGDAGTPQAKAPAVTRGKPARVVEATYIGNKVCLGCHTSQAEAFGHTLMGRLQKQGKLQCESCHGPGSEHAKLGGGRGVGGIISFRADDENFNVKEGNQICLGCHLKGERVYWPASTHETRGVACTNCHTVMKQVSRKFQLRTAFEPDTCFQCHKDRRAQMARTSHMPLREGKIVCSDCHNPHGSFTQAMLRTDSINDTCYKCHAEKRGPFLFEHAPVRENCVNCHDPHGSINEYMLKISRPRLCTECHAFGHGTTSGPLAVQTISRQCQNCHTEVHGTNSPSGALLHR
jgi:DmsE family decaheme c-type cytochrome